MTHIFVNLPSSDLDRSEAFYAALGYEANPQFSDENARSIVVDDNIVLMLLRREFLATFTPLPVVDPSAQTQALIGLSRASRAAVDESAEASLGAGGHEVREAQDYGFMYGRSLADPDGNILEFIWMDPDAA